ncbi:hypothetical protein D3C71_1502000 [compost metagenome]
MQQDFLDLFHRHAVVQRALDVQLDLGRTVQRRQHRQVQHAARLLFQAGPPPGVAPAPFGGDVLKGHHEVVGAGQRAVHVFGTQHFAAQVQALIEQGLGFGFDVCHEFLGGEGGGAAWMAAGYRLSDCQAIFTRTSIVRLSDNLVN